ncbi:hypothetical protein K0U91_04170 [Chryseobacterium chendengshani]|uniref:hypothetical protein n=1 Tax=Chryseobacterium sp. LJ668 TaxID=2864040 RepID=UPI001C68D25A|nr:hypothetical protein [Chryseobacterium sp. LJ668]MBW8524608.1 hypothetical protein [Chryseobacterium sp. LJ668]QYK17331.1 hypothetical protein K0U91_04170 [Chryseobacterium sp. LJ668]
MKKFLSILMLAFAGLFILSCDDNDEVVQVEDNDTYATAYDISPTFIRSSSNLYQFSDEFNDPLVESDVVLIYMQTGTANNSPVWRLLPYTVFVGSIDEVDYNFDFSKFDIQINVNSTPTLNLDANSTYYAGKRFRVVVVPAKTGKNSIDHKDYNAVIKYYGIDESKIKLKN